MKMLFSIKANETCSYYDCSYYEIETLETIKPSCLFLAHYVYLKISDKKMISDIFAAFKDSGGDVSYTYLPETCIDNKFRVSYRDLDLHEIPEFIYFVIKRRTGAADIIFGPDEPIRANTIICETAVERKYPRRRLCPYEHSFI